MTTQIDRLLSRPSITGWEMRAGLEVFATHCVDALELDTIRVQWSAHTSTAAMSATGDLILANVKDDAKIRRPLFVRYIGFVVHELLHRKYTDFTAVSKTKTQYLAALHNACEDIYIERRGIVDGFVGNISQVLSDLIAGMVVDAIAEVADWSDPRQYPFALAVFGRRYAPAIPLADGLRPIFEEASKRIDNCANSWDTLAVAEWVAEQLQLPPGDDGDGQNDEGEGDDSGEGQEGEGQEGEGQPGEGEGQEGEGNGQPGEGQGQDQGEGQGQGEGAGQGQEGQEQGQEGQQEGAGAGQGHTDGPPSPGQRRSTAGVSKPREVEPTIDPGRDRAPGEHCEARALVDSRRHLWPAAGNYGTAPVPARLRNEVRRLFDNSGRSEWQLNRRTGAIDPSALAGTASGNVRPFKQRLDTEGIDSAVVLLIDISSSMEGPRANAAIPACMALLETLAAAEVDVCVMAFSCHASIIKPWNMPARKAMQLLPKLRVEGGTKDYSALRLAHGLLLRHPAQRKVVFSLSDGDGDTKEARAQNIAASRLGITTIGIGIRHDVSFVYAQCVRVDDLADLGQTMFKHIKLAA